MQCLPTGALTDLFSTAKAVSNDQLITGSIRTAGSRCCSPIFAANLVVFAFFKTERTPPFRNNRAQAFLPRHSSV